MNRFFSAALLVVLAAARAGAAVDGESDAWNAALALKQKKQQSEQGALAFEAFATTYPQSTRVNEALVEAGVCWFAAGKDKQVLHRNTPEVDAAFKKALERFQRVLTEHPTDPLAARAQYMSATVRLFSGDLPAAERDCTTVLEKFASDKTYYGKALERRAAVRRHLLQPELSVADLRLYQKEVPKNETTDVVARYLDFATQVDKPAVELDIEAWIQGTPANLRTLQGKVVALYFFASWCPKCAAEKTFVSDLHQRYESMGFTVVGVVDHSEQQTVDSVRTFLKSELIPFPVMMDHGKTMTAFKGTKIPDLVLIDRRGVVRWHDHPANLSDYTIETLLAEEPGAAAPVSR